MASDGKLASAMLRKIETRPVAWTNADLGGDVGLVQVTEASRTELLDTAELLDANPLPTVSLQPSDFELPACRSLMREAKEALDNGVGFAV